MKFIPAALALEFQPANAVVKMNGKKVGDRSPLKLDDIPPGKPHTFTFEHAMYIVQTKNWEFKPREMRSEKVVLLEKRFNLQVDSVPPGAWITLDGHPKGRTPKVIESLGVTQHYQLALKRRRA